MEEMTVVLKRKQKEEEKKRNDTAKCRKEVVKNIEEDHRIRVLEYVIGDRSATEILAKEG